MESIVSWHVSPILSAKMRKILSQYKQLMQTLDIGINVFGPTFDNKNSQYFQTKV